MVYIRCLGIDVVEVPSRGIATLIRVVIQPCGTDVQLWQWAEAQIESELAPSRSLENLTTSSHFTIK